MSLNAGDTNGGIFAVDAYDGCLVRMRVLDRMWQKNVCDVAL